MGPTGVGKTEVSRQLAEAVGVPLLRFDMSEYMERHAIAKLIGSPPGYVGFEQAGKLTNQVIKHPYSVILLDEIEKAHPDVTNLFLQVMDYGMLTDGNGRTINFRNTVLIFTTNLGAMEASREGLGFVHQDLSHDMEKAVSRFFSPELRNRMDAIVRFHPLSPEVMGSVVSRQLSELGEQLAKKGVQFTFDKAALAALAQEGYDPKMGARPLERLIKEKVRHPVSALVLSSKLKEGDSLKLHGSDLQLKTTSPKKTTSQKQSAKKNPRMEKVDKAMESLFAVLRQQKSNTKKRVGGA